MARDATAQGGALDVSYGRWWHRSGGHSATYAATWQRALVGPFDYGLAVTHLNETGSAVDRSQTGGQVSLALGGRRAGLYAIGAFGVGMRHDDGNLDSHWSAGGGYAIHPTSFLRLGVEARYRAEDQATRGFWRLDATDRRGLVVQAGIALRFNNRSRNRPVSPGRPSPAVISGPAAPTEEEVDTAVRTDGGSEEAARLTASIVQTALDNMGAPYRWGGTDQNGFDCSGLIHHAYAENGIILPRVSRDQARTGRFVEPQIDHIRPGDILGFAVEGTRVTHVGLYVGNGQFIHSASGGVNLSSLTSSDPSHRWWQQRWVVARRILD
jgi:cell wall-associated NlpC family hydrolase